MPRKKSGASTAEDPAERYRNDGFPRELFVHREYDGTAAQAHSFVADTKLEDVAATSGSFVAVYRLVKVSTFRVDRKLEPR